MYFFEREMCHCLSFLTVESISVWGRLILTEKHITYYAKRVTFTSCEDTMTLQ